MIDVYAPSLWIADVADPVRYAYDSGGVPGSECKLLLNISPGMRGVYRIKGMELDLKFGRAVLPQTRLYVEKVIKS